MTNASYSAAAQAITSEIASVLKNIDEAQIADYIAALRQANKVFFVGVGRVALALETTVKRLNHIGITACEVGAINEPPIAPGDVLVVGSGSGESIFPKHIAQCAKRYGATVVHLTSSPASTIARMSDVVVDFHCGSKSGSGTQMSIQPMTTLFEQSLMIFGDLICLRIMDMQGMTFEQVRLNHANLE
ncbi:6-phospho-3-hexuloisomerase [Raoultella sp. BIGb0138]|uniref:6-phospho-3-hexuloisomerase n=1 Tax=Raoultella sp. BIGb0138 TaxID=2485115 RepID=UPI001051C2FA|nr:6-phospho-3-hexuloisomerase [Raoultella sp. BIGb0138]TCW17991.1 6-phospho-3-hexuloisomerase [Raoultella sp. BIGb0138]